MFFLETRREKYLVAVLSIYLLSANTLWLSRVRTAMWTLGQCHPFRDTRDFSLRDLETSFREISRIH